MQPQVTFMRTCLLLAVCPCILVTVIGCGEDSGTKSTPSFSDEEIEALQISILWKGRVDRPAPEVVFVVGKGGPAKTITAPFKPTVMLSKKEARAVLEVLMPIYERNEQPGEDIRYIVDIESVQRHLSFPIGADRKSQAAALAAVSEKVGTEGKSAIAPLTAR